MVKDLSQSSKFDDCIIKQNEASGKKKSTVNLRAYCGRMMLAANCFVEIYLKISADFYIWKGHPMFTKYRGVVD